MTTTTILVLTLILNGGQPELTNPITTDLDAEGARQIAIPVRDVFEAAGYVVQYWDGAQRRVEITGHADRLPQRHLMRKGTLYFDRAEVRSAEYVSPLPFPVQAIEGTLYAPAVAMQIIAGGEMRVNLDDATLHWDTFGPDDPPDLAIDELLSNLPAWLHRRVRIEGTFFGPEFPADEGVAIAGAPAPGAWVVGDDSGAIHCTDSVWMGWLHTIAPDAGRGQHVSVTGIVRPGYGGFPYLSHAHAITAEDE